MTTQDVSQTIEVLTEQVAAQPNDLSALHNLAVLLSQIGRVQDALAYAQKAAVLGPDQIEVWLNLGNLQARTGKAGQAVAAFGRVTELAPDDLRGWFNCGNVLALLGRWQESTRALENAHKLAPDRVDILASLALSYRKHVRLNEAVATYEKALELEPSNATIHSNLLVALQYKTDSTPASLYDAHQAWNSVHGQPVKPALDRRAQTDGPIRVGYVSGDFRAHPIGYFLSGVLRAHDRSKVVSLCFSDTQKEDSMTDDLRAHADKWIDTRNMPDRAFCDTVQKENVDILIDLSGHLSHSRLTAFAHKPAPVQATWAGYVGTTGLANMDWLIADRCHAPDGFETHTTERIARLPHDYICYAPPDNAPEVLSPPCSDSESITFGCFNNLVKLNDRVLSTWAEVLSTCPNSKLLLKCAGLDQSDICDRIRQAMDAGGIDRDRLDLRAASPHTELLASYNEVDIALDPFPYSGGLTTLEALWMGVPVLTKTGETFAGRHSTSHLSNLGLQDWVTENDSEYVERAVEKAADRSALMELRQSLRQRMAGSPVCDHSGFTRAIERAYRMMVNNADQEKTDSELPRVYDIQS